MASEIEFVQTRLQIIKERIDDLAIEIEPIIRMRLQREQRLLQRVGEELTEGEVLETLGEWRQYLGILLMDHKFAKRAQQRKYDRWLRLSREQREITPQPEQPTLGTTSIDKHGNTWVIDDRFLAMMDDLIKRLQKWLGNPSRDGNNLE